MPSGRLPHTETEYVPKCHFAEIFCHPVRPCRYVVFDVFAGGDLCVCGSDVVYDGIFGRKEGNAETNRVDVADSDFGVCIYIKYAGNYGGGKPDERHVF